MIFMADGFHIQYRRETPGSPQEGLKAWTTLLPCYPATLKALIWGNQALILPLSGVKMMEEAVIFSVLVVKLPQHK